MKKNALIKICMIAFLSVASFGVYSSTCERLEGSWDNEGWCGPVPDGEDCLPWGQLGEGLPNCLN